MPEKSQPRQNPPSDKASQKESGQGATPSGTPPSGVATQSGGAEEARPRDLTSEEAAAITAGVTASAAQPTMMPPPQVQAGASTGGIGAWTNYHKVTALWSINQNRNSWIHLENVGWRKLANNSDSAIVALSILAAHAKQTQTPYYNGREEADGMIHECFVW